MKSQREELLKRLQRAIHEDDLTKKIASHQNEISEPQSFFQEQLKKHEQLSTYLQQNLQAQDNILRALADANALFTTDRKKILDATQQRSSFVDSLVFSYQSLDELFEKANKGVNFFASLNKSLEYLLKEAHEFCNKSREEREARQKLLQRFSGGQQNQFPVGPVFSRQIPKSPQSVSDFGSTDRPRLKDFLPHIKPESWGQTGAATNNGKPRSVGPPQVDRTSFGPPGANFNQIQMPQVPQDNQVVRPNFGTNQPGMIQPGRNQNIPVGPPKLQNPANFQSSMIQPGMNQPGMIQPNMNLCKLSLSLDKTSCEISPVRSSTKFCDAFYSAMF